MTNPVDQTMSILSVPYRVGLAGAAIENIPANSFIGIGAGTPWSSNDSYIPTPIDSTDYYNAVRKNLVAIKNISAADTCYVIPRSDWSSGTYYSQYSNATNMFAYTAVSNANGTVTAVPGNTQIVGNNSTFFLDYSNNSLITLSGDGVYVLPQTREVINVVSNTSIVVNNAFTFTYTANIAQKSTNYFPNYAQNFYVRNTFDQVFVCLSNNGGIASTDMPKISLGGQLPTSPYIVAADGYLWKYMYIISPGYKQNFFTWQWMPCLEDSIVNSSAQAGRIDIINVISGGIGYNGNVASPNAPILSVSGDGMGANITAIVSNTGTITGINILNGGSNYTTATISTTGAGSGANIQAVISPQGGWGSNSIQQLGATAVMISVSLDDTENGTIPTVDFWSNYFTYRQISILDSMTYSSNGTVANSTNYDMTSAVQCASQIQFNMGDTVYQAPNNNINYATFQGTVVWFDVSTLNLHLNNTSGTFAPGSPIIDNNLGTSVLAYGIMQPLVGIFSGNLDFIENRAKVTRSPGQTESIKIILQF